MTVVRGDATVLRDVSVEVADGERLAIIGPSGSGKTSLLRALAGLDPTHGGVIRIGGHDVTGRPARDRDLAMVFQDATLQPHLSVRRNIGFPLRLRRTPRGEEERRVRTEARALTIEDLLDRRPRQLSAGDRHAVSTARSLVRRSAGLLLDEPLAQIDPHRRAAVRAQLRTVQEGYGVTLVVATNEPDDALSLGQRIAVLVQGRIAQVGPTADLLRRPASVTVADLLADPPMNLLRAEIRSRDTGVELCLPGLSLPSHQPLLRRWSDRSVHVGLHPHALRLRPGRSERLDPPLAGLVRTSVFHAPGVLVTVELRDGQHLAVTSRKRVAISPGTRVEVGIDREHVHVFDPASGDAVVHGLPLP